MIYHKSIDTLPYWNFLQIRKHNDLRYLYHLDNYLDLSRVELNSKLLTVWNDIMTEYNDELIKRERGNYLFDLEKQIKELEAERFISQLYLSQILIYENDDRFKDIVDKYKNELSDIGYSYNGNIDATQGKIDSILNEIDSLQAAINSTVSTSNNQSSPEKILNEIEKYRKVAIDIRIISVKQYIEYENDFIQYVSNLNKTKRNASN